MPVIKQRIPWDRQPQVAARIDWSNPIARGLLFAITPHGTLVGPGKIATPKGIAYAFDPAVPTPINTGVTNASVVSHSGVIICRHPLMSGARNPQYMGSRVSGNNGWALYQSAASGSFPTQLMGLGYVHGGVAAYAMGTATIGGLNTNYSSLGFSATVSGNLTLYALGLAVHSASIGAINQSSDAIRIGRDVMFSNQPGDYETPLIAYWNRRLSDAEHRSISVNPWQIFAP